MASADKLIAVFTEAKARSAGPERDRFLAGACGEDTELKGQVLSLLEADSEEGRTGFLKNTMAIPVACITEKPGDRIGRYKLLQQLGEGGCGVVYMAEQEEPVRRRVALKVIKLGMDTKSVMARFEAERQALALMDHPNIAKVFDAGATDTGRPFFVMELVRGIKITDYSDQNNLTTEQRLELFTQVCHAVQHAHQKGIIHRDLKPSNILVSLHDGVPVPKVIDFGVAKATSDQRLTDKTVFTAFEQFIGTPAYMSPEQAEMSGLDIDTRSDIYSLGVLLYEMLTGRTPLDPEELLRSGMNEMRRKIRENEPPRPSTRLSTMQAADLTTIAKHRQADAPKLIHLVHGDLDLIVMKCLEKDRARRYETANGLSRDIERHLNNEPITARPPTRLYRLQKLIQRNKLTFAAVGVLATALVLVAVGSTVAAWRVTGARRAERSEREKAQTANRQLRQTVSLLELERAEDLFNGYDAAAGVAHLSAMLRRDPSNSIAASRLVSALTQRGWAVPTGVPMLHTRRVPTASFSPDGRHVLSASWDKTAGVWDAVSGHRLFALQHEGIIFSARYSADGRRIVTASADGRAQIWDAMTGAAQSLLPHSNKVHWAEFSREGTLVVTACADNVARIWDADTGKLKRELHGHTRPILIARFAPDARLLATANDWGALRLWSVESGEMAFQLAGYPDSTAIETLAFSRDGHRLVSAGYDHTARLWNVATGEPIGEPLAHQLRVWHAEFSPDSKLLLTACEDGAARLWDVQTLRAVGEPLRHESGVIFGQFSPDGQSVVTTSSDNTARVWDVRTQTPLCQPLRYPGRVLHAGFSPEGGRLVTASYYGITEIWELRKPLEPAVQIQHNRNVVPIALSPDGATVLTAGHDKTLRLWEVRTGQPLSEPMPQKEYLTFGDFAPDGRRVALAFTDHAVRVWDYGEWKALHGTVTNPRVVAGPLQHGRRIHSVRFSGDGSRLVTASADGTARVWDAMNGQPITASLVHTGEVEMAQFSHDGRWVVSASDDRTARVWDAQSGRPLTEPLAHGDHVKWAEFSPDGTRVATASTDNTACLWDARTGRKLLTMQHARIVNHAAFSPDGRRIATASLDRTAQIWDASTGQALTPPMRHERPVGRAYFSPDARRIFTLTWDGPARVWDSDTGRPLSEWLHTKTTFGACFDTAIGRVILGATNGIAQVWNMPEAPMPVPEWFPRFAEAVAGIRLGERGAMELVPREKLKDFATQIPAGAETNYYEQIAGWFLKVEHRLPE